MDGQGVIAPSSVLTPPPLLPCSLIAEVMLSQDRLVTHPSLGSRCNGRSSRQMPAALGAFQILPQELLGHKIQHAAALNAGHPPRPCSGAQQRRKRTPPAHHQYMSAYAAQESPHCHFTGSLHLG